MNHNVSLPRSWVAGLKERDNLIFNIVLLAPAFLLTTIVFLLPLAIVLKNSVLTRDGPSLFYFTKFLSDPYYLGVLWRTFRLGLIGMLVTLVPGYILAYNMVFHPSRAFRTLIVAVTMVPLAINLLVRIFGWIAILSSQGTIHELLSLAGRDDVQVRLLYSESAIVIGSVHSHLTFMVLPIAAALSKIDVTLLRAAQNSRCRTLAQFRSRDPASQPAGHRCWKLAVLCPEYQRFRGTHPPRRREIKDDDLSDI